MLAPRWSSLQRPNAGVTSGSACSGGKSGVME
jgi:hypothetical protein